MLPLRVLHIITGLESGGAERILFQVVSRLDRAKFDCRVISLTGEGPQIGAQLRAGGIAVQALGGRPGVPDPRLFGALAAQIRQIQPDLIQTWLHHADLAGGLAARLARSPAPVLWNVHNTAIDPKHGKRQTAALARLNVRLARFLCRGVVCVSDAVRDDCLAQGYPAEKLHVIVNGVDTTLFVPDDFARSAVRRELNSAPETPLIGLMARFDPQKDHETFCRAAGILHRQRPDVHFVLCGTGIVPENAVLTGWLRGAGVESVTHLLGLRGDLPRITAALDAATCCSRYAESFALVLAEAMSCGVPCVTTDLPGPVSVIGDVGRIVPIGDPEALANAWQTMLSLPPGEAAAQKKKGRLRVEECFSLMQMVQGYETLYTRFAAMPTRKQP